jgi:hypothetical protein
MKSFYRLNEMGDICGFKERLGKDFEVILLLEYFRSIQ